MFEIDTKMPMGRLTIPEDPIDLEELNNTELRQLYRLRFAGGSPGFIHRFQIIQAIRSGVSVGAVDILDVARGALMELVDYYKPRAGGTISCDGICVRCPPGSVINCYNDNENLLIGGDYMTKQKKTLYAHKPGITMEEIEEAGVLENRPWMLQFCASNGLVDIDHSIETTAVELVRRIKEHFGVKDLCASDWTSEASDGKKEAPKEETEKPPTKRRSRFGNKGKAKATSKKKTPKADAPPPPTQEDMDRITEEAAEKTGGPPPAVVVGESGVLENVTVTHVDNTEVLEAIKELSEGMAKGQDDSSRNQEMIVKDIANLKESMVVSIAAMTEILEGIDQELNGLIDSFIWMARKVWAAHDPKVLEDSPFGLEDTD